MEKSSCMHTNINFLLVLDIDYAILPQFATCFAGTVHAWCQVMAIMLVIMPAD